MKTVSYVSMTMDLDGNVIEPLTTKTLQVPNDTQYDEHGEAEVAGHMIYSPRHDTEYDSLMSNINQSLNDALLRSLGRS
jgi:hypothetical protein